MTIIYQLDCMIIMVCIFKDPKKEIKMVRTQILKGVKCRAANQARRVWYLQGETAPIFEFCIKTKTVRLVSYILGILEKCQSHQRKKDANSSYLYG